MEINFTNELQGPVFIFIVRMCFSISSQTVRVVEKRKLKNTPIDMEFIPTSGMFLITVMCSLRGLNIQ